MSEEAIVKQIRRLKDKTATILDEESFCVGETRGKLSAICDFICLDKMGYKLAKVCLDYISKKELDTLLSFNDSRYESGTILQLFFWRTGDQRPFYRPKLFYNQPKQLISDELKKLVK